MKLVIPRDVEIDDEAYRLAARVAVDVFGQNES